MKKSELYTIAITCVIDDKDYPAETKIGVIERLLEDRNVALYVESKEGENA